MSFSTSSVEPSPQPFVLSSPDRVVVRALPHSLPSTNKKVTLTLRRTSPSPQLTQPLSPTSSHASSPTEPTTVPHNNQIANTQHKTMISTLTSSIQEQDVIFSPPMPRCVTLNMPNPQSLKFEIPAPSSPSVSTKAVEHSNPNVTRKYSAQFHRNGLPIKSALKGPPIATSGKPGLVRPFSSRSRSSPTLTTPKYVHFNTQLEHVRLFLQGETPSCVSDRETIVDSREHDRSTSGVKITQPNWTPASSNTFKPVDIDSGAAPMCIENIILLEDQSELEGKILIQNIAFHKHVSVRYTADFWQTYTEVSAEFEESIPGSSLDRFLFTIPLEMDCSVIEKTFCMAVRYQVIGREFWDSNNGKNYQIECKRVVVAPPPATASDLSKQMNKLLLGSPLPEYSKPVLRKKLANRYDLSTSLSAAYSQPVSIPIKSSYLRNDNSFKPSIPA
ncbi:hypothetical protein BGZ76_002603, partial [Entomortierella beljakovae]